jgi:hypothetical protein
MPATVIAERVGYEGGLTILRAFLCEERPPPARGSGGYPGPPHDPPRGGRREDQGGLSLEGPEGVENYDSHSDQRRAAADRPRGPRADPSHGQREPDKLGKAPLLDLGLRLGEGSGALAAVPLVRLAAACVTDVATFSEWGLSR